MNSKTYQSTAKTRLDFLNEVVKPMVKRRKELKMTQADVNDKLGVADFLVAKWECGIRSPTAFNLLCWAEVLDGSIVFRLNKALTPEMTLEQAKNDNKQNC